MPEGERIVKAANVPLKTWTRMRRNVRLTSDWRFYRSYLHSDLLRVTTYRATFCLHEGESACPGDCEISPARRMCRIFTKRCQTRFCAFYENRKSACWWCLCFYLQIFKVRIELILRITFRLWWDPRNWNIPTRFASRESANVHDCLTTNNPSEAVCSS